MEAELADIRSKLGDNQIYRDESREVLAELLRREGELKARAGDLEERWLEQQQALEELAASG